MRIAVTGASGRLGRLLTEAALGAGHEVIALDRLAPEVPFGAGVVHRQLDLADYDGLLAAVRGADALVHLAALTRPDQAAEPRVHDTNVTASYHALLAAERAGIRRICLASSVNAIGAMFSDRPRYAYFPVDESHPAAPEDPYSLSKWIAEEQAAAIARRRPGMSIACLRVHALREADFMAGRLSERADAGAKDLWGYTPPALATATCLGAISTDLGGAEVFYVAAATTYHDEPSEQLRLRYYPAVPVRRKLTGHTSFFDSTKAEALLSHAARAAVGGLGPECYSK